MTFRLDGSAADEHNGANGVVILFLFEDGAETVYTGIAIEEKRAAVVGDEDRRLLGEKFPHNGFDGVKTNLTPCLRREVMGRIRVAVSRGNFQQ